MADDGGDDNDDGWMDGYIYSASLLASSCVWCYIGLLDRGK